MGRLSKPSLLIVVLEDDHHERVIYRYLKECEFKPHEIRIIRSPAGEGSAENWVKKRFAQEVGAYRVRQAKAETGLIASLLAWRRPCSVWRKPSRQAV
jgi:hypothetical protein